MTNTMLMKCERSYGLRVTSSAAKGLNYIAAPNDKRIAIAGSKGVTILTDRQVKALLSELKDVYEMQVERR